MDNHDKLTVKPHAQTTCASCNTPFTGKYCPDCGEKQLDRHDFAIQHYLEETLEGFTHFDNKFFRSVKILVTWPGLLTQYFSTGKRVSFLKPFQLFLICNLVFFLLAGKLNIFAQSLYSFYTYEPYTYFNTKPTILAKATTDADFKTLAAAFNERVGTDSKLFIALFIPVLGLVFWPLFIRSKKYFTEHLIFATHFFSFVLIYFTAYTVLIVKPFYWLSHVNFSSTFDLVTSVINMVVFAVYLTLAAVRYYGVSRLWGVVSSLITTVLFVVLLMGYRLLIFYKIIWSISIS